MTVSVVPVGSRIRGKRAPVEVYSLPGLPPVPVGVVDAVADVDAAVAAAGAA